MINVNQKLGQLFVFPDSFARSGPKEEEKEGRGQINSGHSIKGFPVDYVSFQSREEILKTKPGVLEKEEGRKEGSRQAFLKRRLSPCSFSSTAGALNAFSGKKSLLHEDLHGGDMSDARSVERQLRVTECQKKVRA